MKIAIVGTGYVGLATAILFSKLGHQVVGLDIDKEKIRILQKGKAPFYEPDLNALIKKGLKKKTLSFTSSYFRAIPQAKVVFICVGTPSKKSGEINLSYIKKACQMIGRVMKKPVLVVIKSTVPPGIPKIVKKVIAKSNHVSFDLATCPEFLREGSAVEDTFHPDRIIIGAETTKAAEILLKLHEPIKAPKYVFDINSAQMVKYSANAFLANKISFANQIANLCDHVGADAKLVMLGLGLDHRIGRSFLRPGLGFGGSCFPKDTAALCFLAQQYSSDLQMVKAALIINDSQVDIVLGKIKKLIGVLQGKTVAVLGLSFKPNTDDLRQAQSIPLIKKLLFSGARVKTYDPVAMFKAKKILKGLKIEYSPSAYEAAKNAHALVLVTEWPEFKKLQFGRLKKLMKNASIVDGRNLWEPRKLKKLGFRYLGVGRR